MGFVDAEIEKKLIGQVVFFAHAADRGGGLRTVSSAGGKRCDADLGGRKAKVAAKIVASGIGNGDNVVRGAQGRGFAASPKQEPGSGCNGLRELERNDVVKGQERGQTGTVRHDVVGAVVEGCAFRPQLFEEARDAPLLANVERRRGRGDGYARQPGCSFRFRSGR